MKGLISELSSVGFSVLEVMKKDLRYVLGVADEAPPNVSFERIKRVSELVEKYGKHD